MTNKLEEKLFRYQLHALPNGKFNFLKIDPDDPKAPKPILFPDKTQAEVREFYRTKWGYSDAEIDERLRAAQQELEGKSSRSQAQP
jgi:hypothetical protein